MSANIEHLPAVKPEDRRRICEEQDKAREALRKRIGEVRVAVDLVRDARK